MYAIGLDIGGTKIKGCITDQHGVMLNRFETVTPVKEGREGILSAAAFVIDSLQGTDKVIGIGIGSAGRINEGTGEVVFATSNLPGWQGVNLKTFFEDMYKLPVFAVNDANAALWGEAQHYEEEDLVMLTLGTGVGGANRIRGNVLSGAHHQSGEWGHVVLVPNGRPCNCGRRGCAEQYLSGTALNTIINERTSWKQVRGSAVFDLYAGGDPEVVPVVEEYMEHLGIFIENIAHGIDPDAVIIGGGIIESKEHWWNRLLKRVEGVRVIPAVLGNQAGMIGASQLVFHSLKSGVSGR
ncbi:ROK family protein [Metabacillus indicus]|uniref:ROK family protein n=1 Tax=Metabacillus indicus TaxID=246786 RepID=UPI002A05199D|nr:ROK family protein [Metabacillus indicus]MDX8288998.1 ROK family protein [Metabacillus indicus]